MKKPVLVVVLLLIGAVTAYLNPQWYGEAENGKTLLYGNVDIREVQLGFRAAGRLQAMHFEEGDAVAVGDLLATLDDRPMREALAVAEARVLEARARMDRFNTGSRPQEIQQADARVKEAQAALENAEQDLRRQRELTKAGLSSQRLLDSAVASHDQAAARLDANSEAFALAVEGFRVEEIAEAQAGLVAAQAQRDQAQTQVEDAQLLAPNAGVVQTRIREPGSMVAVGAPVYTVSLTQTIYVRAYVGESQLGRVAPGSTVYITTDSSDQRYQGQVGFISPRAEFTPKTVETPELRTDLVYRLRIVVANPEQNLRQGMPVTVELLD
jgi:HlyD family secretion protein